MSLYYKVMEGISRDLNPIKYFSMGAKLIKGF
jgi:hypothetical protein